jgi:hypothetical protein
MSGAVRGTASWERGGTTGRTVYCYTQAENIEKSEKYALSEFTVPILSGRVIAICHSPRNLPRAHLSHS